jgi:glutathione synthase/RimK-type ligase-like ATP-grasp enzyme
MAIFSQSNKMTETDYRNYDLDNPNRIVPYKLNKQLENKLILLLENLELNSGSIDLIKSKDGKYYFLEVNPVGQFGQLSYNCNYNIEKIIAKSLCI